MVRCKIDGNARKDRWAKIVTGADRKAKGGYSIQGEFCNVNTELDLEVGSVVVRCDKDSDVYVYQVQEGAEDNRCLNLRLVTEEGKSDYLSLRRSLPSLLDRIEQALSSVDPRQAAIDEINQLLQKHKISAEELSW